MAEPNPIAADPAAEPAAGPIGYDPDGRPVEPPAADARGASYGTDLQQTVRDWIVENETLAVLAGFALGVFIGALMRR